MDGDTVGRTGRAGGDPPKPVRWECGCRRPAVLLGTYEPGGRVHIKVRDRYWHVRGRVETVCPRCGGQHVLDTALPIPVPGAADTADAPAP